MTMSGLGNRTAILTLSRLASYGLQLISPIFLVRLLTVADFGRYREFLLYAAILQAFAQFSINDSLLYCVPANPHSPWRLARQTALLTLCSSVLVVLVLVGLNLMFAIANKAWSEPLHGRWDPRVSQYQA